MTPSVEKFQLVRPADVLAGKWERSLYNRNDLAQVFDGGFIYTNPSALRSNDPSGVVSAHNQALADLK